MKKILIVGMGALGTRVAPLLKEHNLTLLDYDIVQQTNLERQPLYKKSDIGKNKVDCAKTNLGLDCDTIAEPFQPELAEGHDLIVDCTDNLQVRMQLNDTSLSKNIPLLIATVSKNHGFVFPVVGSPCWQCISLDKVSQDDCSTSIDEYTLNEVASLEAELSKTILSGATPEPVLHMVNGTSRKNIGVMLNPNCEACKNHFKYLDPKFKVGFCKGTQKLQARPNRLKTIDLDHLGGEVLEKFSTATRLRLANGNVLVHKHGLLEFEDVPEPIAKAFSQRLL